MFDYNCNKYMHIVKPLNLKICLISTKHIWGSSSSLGSFWSSSYFAWLIFQFRLIRLPVVLFADPDNSFVVCFLEGPANSPGLLSGPANSFGFVVLAQ